MADATPTSSGPPPQDNLRALLLNRLVVTARVPAEIIPGHVLRRPSIAEAERLRRELREWSGSTDYTLIFESRHVPGSSTVSYDISPHEADWHYWLVEATTSAPRDVSKGFSEIEQASKLTNVELNCRLLLYQSGSSLARWQGADPFASLSFIDPPLTIDEVWIAEIQEIFGNIKALDPKWTEVTRALDMYYRLGAIQKDQPMYVVGVFSIIEALLTHRQRPGEAGLSHQIQTKMNLLHARFRRPLDLSRFPPGFTLCTLWDRLYAYRSCVAHGKRPDFADKLQLLVNADTANRFLDDAAKALLKHAMIEPQLVTDLRHC